MLRAIRLAAVLALVHACSCERSEEPLVAPEPAVRLATRAERIGAARQPMSADTCKAACAAAGAITCKRLHQTCGYEPGSGRFVFVGGYVLGCKPADAVACLGKGTGMDICVQECVQGQAATDEAPSPDGTGE